MTIKLERISESPLLKPEKEHPWEAAAVFNCAAVYHHGKYHLVYRAADIDSSGKEGPFVSSLGLAVSSDGIHFERFPEPYVSPEGEQELRGMEDPRIVKIGKTFYMMYTGYRGKTPGDYRIRLASSSDMKTWKRMGTVLDESNKDASLFPEKINGRYCMLHRRAPGIWIGYSEDLSAWTDHSEVMGPIASSNWQSEKIGIAGPPVKTKQGWMLIYHGVSRNHEYSLGIALLDLSDPSKVVFRQEEPILSPELPWGKNGCIPNVVFSCGQIEREDDFIVYYAGADTCIGACTLDKNTLFFMK